MKYRTRALTVVAITFALTGCAYVERVDVASDGSVHAAATSSGHLSGDGRYVAFYHCLPLVADDGNGQCDVYLRDTLANTTERVSLSATGGDPDGRSFPFGISADGRYVGFFSDATNLVASGTGGENYFVRDRTAGTTTLVTPTTNGQAPNGQIGDARLSANGRSVAFASNSTNLGVGGSLNRIDAYVRNLDASTTSRVSLTASGATANDDSSVYGLSGDGNLVVFGSTATNLAAGGGNNIYVRNRSAGTTALVNVPLSGPSGASVPADNAISTNGRYVLFNSWSDTNTVDDPVGTTDVFVRDLQTQTTTLVYSPAGIPAAGDPVPLVALNPVGISGDGRYVVLNGLRTGSITQFSDFQVYVVDRTEGRIDMVRSAQGPAFTKPAHATSMSADGAYLTLDTNDPLMVGSFIRSTTVPSISGISPATLARGASTTLDIAGLHFVTGMIFTFGDGITADTVTVDDEHHASVSVTVAADAPTGNHTVASLAPGTGAGPLTGGVGLGTVTIQP